MMRQLIFVLYLIFIVSIINGYAQELQKLDDSAPKAGEWGHRPEDGTTVAVTPPSFTWRPEKNQVRWELEVQDSASNQTVLKIETDDFNAYTPSEIFKPGKYSWKYRAFDKNGKETQWSKNRSFTVPASAAKMPLPKRTELLGRIPKEHPRIFVRPEGMDRLRELSKNELKAEYIKLAKRCNELLKNPPDTTEPPKYKDKNRWKDELDIWWGNRIKTIAVLENAAFLAFVWNLDGNEEYAKLSKKLLMEAAKWDPKGATGFRYNDEAGMPYNYHFSRTYTFLNKYLSEEEKQICRNVIKIRGEEMYNFLCPKLFWTPYSSHDNRSWHFLGELGLAFYDEIPEAADWVWYAMNKFYASYPVWCDDDGGWHEGAVYWSSYQIRFCWWADAMKSAFNINAFDKPYYSQIGYYPMYLMPPGKNGGSLGDLNQEYKSTSCLELVDIVAMQSGNPYWRWYVDAHKTFKAPNNYYTFIRKAGVLGHPKVEAKPPTDLPTSRLFRGTGLAMLNTTLMNSDENVQIQFKSAPAPYGNYSHGYDPNNSYIFSAWNENLLINSGRRDYYGSPHHAQWMWSTRSENNITIDGGLGQLKRSNEAVGEILRFESGKFLDGDRYDILVSEAAKGYRLENNAPEELKKRYPGGKLLDGYRRHIVFLQPDVLIVYDKLEAPIPVRFEYWLHAKNPFQPMNKYFPGGQSKQADKVFGDYLKERLGKLSLGDPEAPGKFETIRSREDIAVRVDKVACRLDLLLPDAPNFMEFKQTNQYDPNPQEKYKVREWHLTAIPTEKKKEIEFLLIAQPWKVAQSETVPVKNAEYRRDENGLTVLVRSNEKIRSVRFPKDSDKVSVK